ncbi:MAG: hypothetical protein E7161_03425 [Firmicutes bacterium]|nr:hypothetical protein [Bacillota bacterium]
MEEFKKVELQTQKIQLLEGKNSFLQKLKIIGPAMFDPEYYAQDKDMPIRTLAKELLDNENKLNK